MTQPASTPDESSPELGAASEQKVREGSNPPRRPPTTPYGPTHKASSQDLISAREKKFRPMKFSKWDRVKIVELQGFGKVYNGQTGQILKMLDWEFAENLGGARRLLVQLDTGVDGTGREVVDIAHHNLQALTPGELRSVLIRKRTGMESRRRDNQLGRHRDDARPSLPTPQPNPSHSIPPASPFSSQELRNQKRGSRSQDVYPSTPSNQRDGIYPQVLRIKKSLSDPSGSPRAKTRAQPIHLTYNPNPWTVNSPHVIPENMPARPIPPTESIAPIAPRAMSDAIAIPFESGDLPSNVPLPDLPSTPDVMATPDMMTPDRMGTPDSTTFSHRTYNLGFQIEGMVDFPNVAEDDRKCPECSELMSYGADAYGDGFGALCNKCQEVLPRIGVSEFYHCDSCEGDYCPQCMFSSKEAPH